jgi:hypothetical protein
MFQLQDLGILDKVDAISSVSGGSITAAYYCLSHDPNTNERGPVWDENTVAKLLVRDYEFGPSGYLANGHLWPPWRLKNFFLINTTGYSRTTVMADVLNRNIFVPKVSSPDGPTFGELNPRRPYLVLNAGNASEDYWAQTRDHQGKNFRKFGTSFTFTKEDFDTLDSDIDKYPVAYGVMASAAFPGVFSYITLKDYYELRYVHLFDGGTIDNLGLLSVQDMISEFKDTYRGPFPAVVVVILVDSQTDNSGAASADPDVRSFVDHIIDVDSVTAFTDHLMAANGGPLNDFIEWQRKGPDSNFRIILWHLTFKRIDFWPALKDPAGANVKLFRTVERIPTDLKLAAGDATRINTAVGKMFDNSKCLDEIRNILDFTRAKPCSSVSLSSSAGGKCAEAPPSPDDCYSENIARPVTVEVKNAVTPVMVGPSSGSNIHFRRLDFSPVYVGAPGSVPSELRLRIKNNMPEPNETAVPSLQCPNHKVLFPECKPKEKLKPVSCSSSNDQGDQFKIGCDSTCGSPDANKYLLGSQGECVYRFVFQPSRKGQATARLTLSVLRDVDSPYVIELSGVAK